MNANRWHANTHAEKQKSRLDYFHILIKRNIIVCCRRNLKTEMETNKAITTCSYEKKKIKSQNELFVSDNLIDTFEPYTTTLLPIGIKRV